LGTAKERNAATGLPPMAAMSLSPRVRQRCPTDSGGCQSRRKWMPSRLKSVVTRNSCPGSSRRTAQSSPMPARTARFEPGIRPWAEDSAMRRIWAISAFSGSGTAHLLYRLGRVASAFRRLKACPTAVEGSPHGVAERPTIERSVKGQIPARAGQKRRERLSHRPSVTILR
jgi:hypothetical protein